MTRMSFDGSEKSHSHHRRRHHHHKRPALMLLGLGYKSWLGIMGMVALFVVLLYLAWRA